MGARAVEFRLTKSRIARWFHQTEGDSTASLPKILRVFQAQVDREEAAERGATEASIGGADIARYLRSMNGFNSSTIMRPYFRRLTAAEFSSRVGVYSLMRFSVL